MSVMSFHLFQNLLFLRCMNEGDFMKDDNAFFVECPFIDFLRIFPQFVNIIDDSTLNEFMKSNDYIVRYNGSVAEIGCFSRKWYFRSD